MNSDWQMMEVESFSQKTSIIVDTNILLHSIELVEVLEKAAVIYNLEIIIPWIVLQELDKLKSINSSSAVSKAARAAISFISRGISSSDHLRGQSINEAYLDLFSNVNNDDLIIDCCMFFAQTSLVILVSNDKNLIIKGRVHKIIGLSFDDNNLGLFLQQLSSSIGKNIDESQLKHMYSIHDPMNITEDPKSVSAITNEIFDIIDKQLESFVLESLEKFLGPEWKFLQKEEGFKAQDFYEIMSRNFIAVFSNVLPRKMGPEYEDCAKIMKNMNRYKLLTRPELARLIEVLEKTLYFLGKDLDRIKTIKEMV